MPLLVGGCKLRCPSKLWKEPQLDISIKNNVWKWQRTSCRENNHSCPEVQVPHSRWILLNSIRTSKANTLFLKRKGLYNFKATIMSLKPSKDHLLTKGRHWQNNNKYPSKKKKKNCILLCHYTNEKGTDARYRLTATRRRDAEGDWKQARESNTKSADVLMQERQRTSVGVGQDLPQTSEVTGWRNLGLAQLKLAEKESI